MATTTSTVSWKTSDVLPDGIYSFSRNENVSFFLKTYGNSTEANAQMILYLYTTPPHIRYTAHANFKVTRVPNTDRYIIRLMSNTNLTLGLSGTNIVTKTISANDSEVSINDTFYINYYNGGYTIQNCTAGYYVCWSGTSGSYVVSGSLSDNAVWRPRGYRSYIEDGVYMFGNCDNTGMYMDTQYDSDSAGRHAQQYAYGSIENTFSRGGMFKIKQIGNTGQYTIRLMTNNLLTWGANSSDEVISESIPLSDDDVPDEQTYYIVYDFSGYMIIPYNTTKAISATANSTASGSSGAPESYLDLINRNTPQPSARWKMYKYDGMPRYGGNIILPDELIDDGGVVGNTYTITHNVWYTMLDTCDYSLTLIDDIYFSQFTYDSDNLSATFTLSNFGKVECSLNASYEANNIVIRDISDTESFNAMPSEGTYYIQNSETEKYANIENPSIEEGVAVEQSGFSTSSYFKWNVEYVEDSGGYVRLKSVFSGIYLAVDPNNSSNIKQYVSPGDNGLWRFELLDDYSVKIICKASESSGKVLAVPLLNPFDGADLTQREYTDNSNCTDEWYVLNITGSEVFLLGMLEEGRDRYTSLGKIMTPLKQLGYKDFNYTITDYIHYTTVLQYMMESKIFVSRSHGNADENGSSIQLFTELPESILYSFDIYDFDSQLVLKDLSNCELVVFVGCYTGKNERSLPYAAVEAGAECAIGFTDVIGWPAANEWTETFFVELANGKSIEDAAKIAAGDYYDDKTNIGSYVIVN